MIGTVVGNSWSKLSWIIWMVQELFEYADIYIGFSSGLNFRSSILQNALEIILGTQFNL